MAEDEPAEELWTFGGIRITKDGKRVHAWATPKGERLAFKAGGSYTVGSLYRVKVTRIDGKVSMYGKPVYTGERSEDRELIDELSAQHRAAEVTASLKARERADKRADPVEQAIERLVELAANVPQSQRTGFAAYVTTKLIRAWVKKD